MDIRKLQRAIVDGLVDVKAQNIRVFNTEHLSPLFERVVVASGTSNRQTKALAASVRDAVKAAGFAALRTEGEDNGEWIIVDCGAAVAHIMQPTIREYYHLEEIWGDKPVALKAVAAKGLPKASEFGSLRAAAKKAAPKKRATLQKKSASVKSTDAVKTAATGKKAVPAKTRAPVKKAASATQPAAAKKVAHAKPLAPAKKAVAAEKPATRKPRA